MRQTTPPLPPLSSATRFRTNSPVFKSHNFTVPSSELVTTNLELNCRQVTALWCLLGPAAGKGRSGQWRILKRSRSEAEPEQSPNPPPHPGTSGALPSEVIPRETKGPGSAGSLQIAEAMVWFSSLL